MKKIVIVALLASGLVACAQNQAPKEDSRLKEAYSACINTAEGSPEKIEACQSVLNVLKKRKRMNSSQPGEYSCNGLSGLYPGA